MPTIPAVNITQAIGNQVSGIASNFLSEGLKALPAIGIALIAIAGIFVIFYWTARVFGWRLRLPVKPPKVKKTNRVHFERSEANIWTAFARLGKIQVPGTRRSGPASGFDYGFVSGFGDSFGLDESDTVDLYGDGEPVDLYGDGEPVDLYGDGEPVDLYGGGEPVDLYAVDGRNGFYADPSFNASWTSDSGPDDSPGAQSGGSSGDMLFFNDAASFYRHYDMDYEAAFNADEHLQQAAIDDLRERDEWMGQFFDAHAASVSANWSRLFPDYHSMDGLASSGLPMDVKTELFRHASILNDLKQQSISSDDLADMDIDYDSGAYDH